jgi:hypothetical protein
MIGLQSNVPSSDLLFNKLAILASCGVNVFCDERGRFQTSGKRSFGVLFDPQYPVCAPLQELKILIRARPTLLLRTITLWGEAPGGGLMQDLADAGDMRRCAWTWVIADCRRNSLGLHSWNQSEDWRFDFSNQRPILVMRPRHARCCGPSDRGLDWRAPTTTEHYKVRRRTKKLLRHSFKFAGQFLDKNANPFTAVIRCTCNDSIDSKPISKWARACGTSPIARVPGCG